MELKDYLVEWDFDIDAGTPRDAAMLALAVQRNPESTATVFKVTEKRTGDVMIIDLDEQPAVAYYNDVTMIAQSPGKGLKR
jgi:hypothetical protein